MTATCDPDVPARPAARRTRVPRRVLLVTGSLGEGHHAAARAVEEQVRRAWPGVEVAWTETLAAMGSGASRFFPAVYAGCMRKLPRLYALYYRLLRVPVFRAGTRAVVGAWSAPGLLRAVTRHEPDLIVATFPEAVQGLGRLRRRGLLPMAVVALVADPAPHPLWLDASLDLHLVSTAEGRALAHGFAPTARVQVGAWPVVAAFRPPDRLGGRRPRPLVHVSGGSLGFGDLAGACAAVLAGGADVLVSCSRDPDLGARLRGLADAHPGRMDVRTWIDDPATVTRHCDAVVTNAGGATALEAIACARPLLLYAPVAGHGRANAEVLARAGLARVCPSPTELTATVAGPLPPPRPPSPEATTAALERLTAVRTGPRVRPQDALFLHVAGPPQQIGACIVVDDPAERDGWREHVVEKVRSRAPGIDLLCRRLAPPRRGRPLRWCHDPAPDAERHVGPGVLTTGNLDEAVRVFFAEPLDPRTAGWELQLVRDGDRVAVLAKAHHALGDGIAVTDALVRLLSDDPGAAPPPGRPPLGAIAHPARRSWTGAGRGVFSLARVGFAPPSPLGPACGPARWVSLRLDGRRVRAAARAHGVGTSAVVLGLVAEALTGVVSAGALRTMTPVTTRTRAGVSSRAAGNRTAALPLDLPLGPMSPAERVRRIAAELEAARRARRAEGAAAVLAGLGLLPRAAQVRLAALVYGPRFFHAIASVLPGRRRGLQVRGATVTAVYPVLPLADGVGLAVGAMHWGRATTLGITCRSAELATRLPALLPQALTDLLGR